jgi:multiple sugar transport system substrate-binding protein
LYGFAFSTCPRRFLIAAINAGDIGRRRMKFALGVVLVFACMSPGTSSLASAETLTINSDRTAPQQKAVLAQIAQEFEQKNPGVNVTINTLDVESYKTAIRNFLVTSPPDLAFWSTGPRMRGFTKRHLFDDISDVFQQHMLDGPMKPFIPAVTDDGKQYMLPTQYLAWGFYYNKELFAKAGVTPPKTWAELMAIAEKFKQQGIVPFTNGTRDLWANDLWFDYLDLRINGLAFHMQLMSGEVPYTDPRVKAVFAQWREPIDKGYFLPNATSYGWQEAVPFLVQGKAAMYLLGVQVLAYTSAGEHSKIGFFPFPQVKSDMPDYEEASLNGIFIPSGAKNKQLARRFLVYLAQPDVLARFAAGQSSLPARLDAPPSNDPFLQEQAKLIAQAAGTSQFFDRDTDPDMAQIGMNGFQEFTVYPDRIDQILQRLDTARKRIFQK